MVKRDRLAAIALMSLFAGGLPIDMGQAKRKIPKIDAIRKAQKDIEKKLTNETADKYLEGLYNGIELALSILDSREPVYK